MKIQTKLVVSSCLLLTLALGVASLTISYTTGKQSAEVLEKITFKELISVRELTAQGIQDYFEGIKGLLQVQSSDPRVIEATKTFIESYKDYGQGTSGLPHINAQRRALENFYSNEFGKKYRTINGKAINGKQLLSQLDDNSVSLQYQYIATNKNPLGSKDALDAAKDNHAYTQAHREFHPHTRSFLNHFGFYDIFIADVKTGHIIYSVFKEVDYATSLIDGPYANSGIGEAFRKAAASNDNEYVYLSDFSSYAPSYEAPASFMASPIYDGTEKIGVLIFQMPIDKVDQIMTHHKKWESSGLGKTGETVLVGADKKLRSISRQLVEDKEAYLQLLKTKKLESNEVIQRIDILDSNIGLHSIDNIAVDKAANNETGEIHYIKYTGNEVLSAYTLVNVLDQQWVILSEMDLAEANAPQAVLLRSITSTSILTALIILGFSIGLILVLSKVLIKPIKKMIVLVEDLASGNGNLCKRLDNSRSDETGELARLINLFIEKILALVENIKKESISLNETVATLESVAEENAQGAIKQQDISQQVDQSMTEMNLAANEAAQSAAAAEQAASKALTVTLEGTQVMQRTSNSIEQVATNVEEAVTIIKELENTSETIGSVVGVINGIAEQTNLLALNAAIEAARAGEQGRGFAVVADEVRALASRTQESTLEINSIIESLQSNANSAVNVMNSGHEAVNICVEESQKTQAALAAIQEQINDINSMNLRIATSAEEQSAVSDTVKVSIEEITEVSTANANGATTAIEKTKEMSDSITKLNHAVGQFTIDECDIR